jgi:hypothetical protein
MNIYYDDEKDPSDFIIPYINYNNSQLMKKFIAYFTQTYCDDRYDSSEKDYIFIRNFLIMMLDEDQLDNLSAELCSKYNDDYPIIRILKEYNNTDL